MQINLQLNTLLWMITGRNTGFLSPLLNANLQFAYSADPRVTAARRALKLDVLHTDFYALGALAALYQSLYYIRDIKTSYQAAFTPGLVPTQLASLAPINFITGEPEVSGGEFVLATDPPLAIYPYYGEDVAVVRNIATWDAPYDAITLTLELDDMVTVEKTWKGEVVASELLPGVFEPLEEVLTLDALEFAGIKANIKFQAAATTASISTPLTRYPFAQLRDLIKDDTQLISLMSDTGTIGAFSTTTNPVTAVGALVAAIVRLVAETMPSTDVDLGDVADIVDPNGANYPIIINFNPAVAIK